MTSSALYSNVRPKSRAGSSCSVTYESTTDLGKCYTPIEVKGYFNQANLGSSGGGAGVRILGGGSTVGLAGVFQKAAFDLSTSPTITGEDNIEDGGGSYNLASMAIQGIEYAFLAEATDKVYRVRIPFTTTPPSSNTTFTGCGLGGGLAEVETLGSLYGTVVAEAGDMLVCIKATEAETCADADYQWVDTGAGNSLSATRPVSPLQISGTYLTTADSCTSSGATPSVTWGYAGLDIALSSAVTVSATNSGGTKTYTVGSSSGKSLTITLDFTLTGALFVPSFAQPGDLNSLNQAQILAVLDSILLKPLYVNKSKSTAAPASDGMLSATASLTVN